MLDIDIQSLSCKVFIQTKRAVETMTTGQLDITAFPLAYAAKFHPEFDITLMPGIVKNHNHALRINKSPFMDTIRKIMDDAGVIVLSDAWLAVDLLLKKLVLQDPASVKGQVMRAAGKAFNQMLEAAGCWNSVNAFFSNLQRSSNWSIRWSKY